MHNRGIIKCARYGQVYIENTAETEQTEFIDQYGYTRMVRSPGIHTDPDGFGSNIKKMTDIYCFRVLL